MPEIDIVLVAPIYEGNVGFCARVMKNFGFSRLVLIDPCPLGNEAKARASHAQDVLAAAETCSIEDVFARSNIVVATTGTVSKSVCHAMRMPFYSPRELRERVKDAGGRISILFGRENWGLNNEEVKRSDMICTIPTAEEYPILNLSHAVGVVCYELADMPLPAFRLASPEDLGYLYQPHRPVPRCHPPPEVQAGEHHDPPPPRPRAVQPDEPGGEHPPRPPAPERMAYRPGAAGPGPDRAEESGRCG